MEQVEKRDRKSRGVAAAAAMDLDRNMLQLSVVVVLLGHRRAGSLRASWSSARIVVALESFLLVEVCCSSAAAWCCDLV